MLFSQVVGLWHYQFPEMLGKWSYNSIYSKGQAEFNSLRRQHQQCVFGHLPQSCRLQNLRWAFTQEKRDYKYVYYIQHPLITNLLYFQERIYRNVLWGHIYIWYVIGKLNSFQCLKGLEQSSFIQVFADTE